MVGPFGQHNFNIVVLHGNVTCLYHSAIELYLVNRGLTDRGYGFESRTQMSETSVIGV